MKKFFTLRERDSASKIRAAFFQEGVYVKKKCELMLLTQVLDAFPNQPRELFSIRIRDLKREMFFLGNILISENPLDVFSQRDLEEEYIKSLVEMNYTICNKLFIHQEKAREIKEAYKLRFIKKGSKDLLYLGENLDEISRHSLREFFHLIPEIRKKEIKGVVL